MEPMRIATWNVNSLNARLPKVLWWLERAKPDVLLMQETKLADDAVPSLPFREAGYALAHHGQGRWNGVAIASRCGIDGVIENFGKPLSRPACAGRRRRRAARRGADDLRSLRAASVYCPSTRPTDGRWARPLTSRSFCGSTTSPAGWEEANDPGDPLALGGDYNVAPEDIDVWDSRKAHRRNACVGGRTAGVGAALPLGLGGRVSTASHGSRPVYLVGLSRRAFSQEPRHAHRSPARHGAGRRSARFGRKSIVKRAKANPPPPITPLS